MQKQQQKLREGENALKNLEDAKWLTLGVLVSNGFHHLNQTVCDISNKNRKAKTDKANRKAMKRQQETNQRITNIKRICAVQGGNGEDQGFASWTMGEMHTYLPYKKEKDNPAMPFTLKKL